MKNYIKQILKEELMGFIDGQSNTDNKKPLELTDGQIKGCYSMMNMLIKGCHWYIYEPPKGSIHYNNPPAFWLINPDKKILMLDVSYGRNLYYYSHIKDGFYRYLNMTPEQFQSFIKMWVEDSLNVKINRVEGNADGGRKEEIDKKLNDGKQIK